ncbi:MAG TPA: hypothetical protein VF167_05730 [Longimicrobiaceae bacterium]
MRVDRRRAAQEYNCGERSGQVASDAVKYGGGHGFYSGIGSAREDTGIHTGSCGKLRSGAG